jgi:diguanylate cyclase
MSSVEHSERIFQLAERAFAAMKTHRSPAYPRSYEVWFCYVTGQHTELRAAVDKVLGEKGEVGGDDIDAIYDTYLSPNRFSAHAERTSAGVLAEIDHVMQMMDMAVGNTTRYGESLATLSNDLSTSVDRNRVRQVVEDLVLATRDAAGTNATLEARLKESKQEIGTLRETLESVRIEALTDPLTGLGNRRHADECLAISVDDALVERRPLSLILIDLDYFHLFNDTWGHLTGDQVLRLVAQTIRHKTKTAATLARFGGEEFLVILPDADLKAAHNTAEQIRQAVLNRELIKRSTGESLGRITLSLGVAELRRGDTAVAFLERADLCLRTAKRLGRNRTVDDSEEVILEDLPDVA